ncbi:SUMF1/EgtB/PvdO family nonheme iron enzyme [Veronia pacifica]|uniref:NirV n=1 Tax=Veronia pacifica TaxID=1080227 RepID=A0A1C3ESJ0_9GAMM|nr:SUMF1/EgtB/PvdO family nonheme iron enzyme [Veronia pacifica]ODA36143.1 NirV precursor [Veronia pacifica]
MSNRLSMLLSALWLILLSGQVVAEESLGFSQEDPVAVLEQHQEEKRTEINTHSQNLQVQHDTLATLINKRSNLNKVRSDLEIQRNRTRDRLDEQYRRLLERPDTTSLGQYQQDYLSAWQSLQENSDKIGNMDLLVSDQQKLVEDLKQQKQLLSNALDSIQEDMKLARVKRINQELSYKDSIELVHTITCDPNVTLAACSKQGKALTMQKAVDTFQSQLIDTLTETSLAKLHVGAVSFNIQVLNSNIVSSGFKGDSSYITRINVEMRSQPDEKVACVLLNFSDRYCLNQLQELAQSDDLNPNKHWINVKIRSNRFDDKVTINGVAYGSTPVEIMLPAGQHQLMVEKPGYQPYSRQMIMTKDSVIWANLEEIDNASKPGKRFSDQLSNNRKAPIMVVIKAGNYQIGQHAERPIKIVKPFSIATTPVTVKQFREFVSETNFVTDAENGLGCSALVYGKTKQLLNHSWRNPGFKQSDNSPVVCISRRDAMAYSNWLSRHTGHNYSLPSETQWEIAARGGSQSDYWWGDDIGVGRANTGWSGSAWSNKSTSPVASFPANPYGVYDTAGNVWEWSDSDMPVARGGAWSFSPGSARVSERLELKPESSANYLGFRVVRNI